MSTITCSVSASLPGTYSDDVSGTRIGLSAVSQRLLPRDDGVQTLPVTRLTFRAFCDTVFDVCDTVTELLLRSLEILVRTRQMLDFFVKLFFDLRELLRL